MIASNGPYHDLTERWKALRGYRDVRVREVACVNARRTLLCAEAGDSALPTVALAAAVHGDEPAGALALLELVAADGLDPRYCYRIWPCLNPSGYDAGTRASIDGIDVNRTFDRGGRSPEAKAVLTANRDRGFLLSLDLHEDADALGFYCYEYGGGVLGRAAIAALDARALAVDPLEATFDTAGPIRDEHCRRERGRIVPDLTAEAALIGGWSYSIAMARRAARYALTLETPARRPFEERVAMHRHAVAAAIAALSQASNRPRV